MIVAIDGPAGSGKSTIAARVAWSLGYQLIDTGAIYRTVALRATELGVDISDGVAVADVAANLRLHFETTPDSNTLYCSDVAIGEEIRTPAIGSAASVVSAHEEVRDALLNLQREMGSARSSVLEGRDIGTVVFPDAEVKIFLTADDRIRAERRSLQLRDKGQEVAVEALLSEMRARDKRDSERAHAPLVKAADAIEIDSSAESIDEVVARVLEAVKARS